MKELNYKPSAYYRLDDISPFQDFSGYDNVATSISTQTGIALTADALFSQVFDSTSQGIFECPVYRAGRESEPFSISASIYPIRRSDSPNSDMQILSNSGQYDGLSINGTTVSFSTRYSDGSEARASFDTQLIQKYDIVGVHSQMKNSLYINGELVDEVDITPEQQELSYASSDTNLYSGFTTSTDAILANAFAFYPHVLQPEDIATIYNYNNRRAIGSVPKMFGGEDIFISTEIRPATVSVLYSTADQWNSGTLTDTVVSDEQLSAQYLDGLSLAGTWEGIIDLEGQSAELIDSVNMFWSGNNVTVEASIDGDIYVTVSKGQNLSIIPSGFDPTGKDLRVRVVFPSGVDDAYIDSLQIRAYMSSESTVANRTVTYNSAVTLDEYEPAILRDDWGVRLSEGQLIIGTDTAVEPLEPLTVEIWVKQGTGSTFTHNLTPVDSRTNGMAYEAPPVGEWVVLHFILGAVHTGTIDFGGDVQIGKIALYPDALTQNEISQIVKQYTGIISTRLDGSGAIGLSESATPVLIYAHDWAISLV